MLVSTGSLQALVLTVSFSSGFFQYDEPDVNLAMDRRNLGEMLSTMPW